MDADRIQENCLKRVMDMTKRKTLSKYKITTFLRQLEYRSNPEKQSNRPIDYLNATVEAAEYKEHPIQGKAHERCWKMSFAGIFYWWADWFEKLEKGVNSRKRRQLLDYRNFTKTLRHTIQKYR